MLLGHTLATNLLWLKMKILGNVWDEWDEWDGMESKAISWIREFSDSTSTHLAEKGYCLILVLLLSWT